MLKQMAVVVALLVSLAVGFIAGKRSEAPKVARCNEAVQVLIKGASVEQLAESSRLMAGE